MPIEIRVDDSGRIVQSWCRNHGPAMYCTEQEPSCGGIQFDFVPPRGDDSPEVYVVGEAPGAQEAEVHQPFVGPSGKILQQALELGTKEGQWKVRFGNTVSCYPTTDTGKGRNPTEKEVRTCAWYVQSDILSSRPDVILAFGKVAAHGLFPGLDLSVREWMQCDLKWFGIPTFVCYHPSYILRKGGVSGPAYAAWRDRIQECITESVIPF